MCNVQEVTYVNVLRTYGNILIGKELSCVPHISREPRHGMHFTSQADKENKNSVVETIDLTPQTQSSNFKLQLGILHYPVFPM